MIHTLIILLGTINTLHASEHTTSLQLPVKLNPAQLAEADLKAQHWFREKITHKKEEVRQALESILPTVLIEMIERYRSPYTNICQRVYVGNLVYLSGKGGCLLTNDRLLVDIPLRYSPSSVKECILHYHDVFLAIARLPNQPTDSSVWIKGLYVTGISEKFKGFIKTERICEILSEPPAQTLRFPAQTVLFPNIIDYQPFLTIYWQNETKPLRRINPAIGNLDHKMRISASCCDILQEHMKIPTTVDHTRLIIVCTICNAHIKSHLTPSYLFEYFPKSEDGYPWCNGKNLLCRTLRALRVFLK